MVAGSGYDACRQDWRHTLAAGPAAWAGNAKSIPRSLDLLADLTVRQFWSVRARNLISTVTLTLCALAVAGAVGMILELEKGFGGLIHISPQPMRQAAKALETQSNDTARLGQNSSNKVSRSRLWD